jgi:hypothetical protein
VWSPSKESVLQNEYFRNLISITKKKSEDLIYEVNETTVRTNLTAATFDKICNKEKS